MVQNAGSATKREITVKWRSEYLSLDQYNEYYKEAITGDNKSFSEETDSDGVKWNCIKIEVLPYASINLTFYKNKKFMDDTEGENAIIITKQKFHDLVQVELSSEETIIQ